MYTLVTGCELFNAEGDSYASAEQGRNGRRGRRLVLVLVGLSLQLHEDHLHLRAKENLHMRAQAGMRSEAVV